LRIPDALEHAVDRLEHFTRTLGGTRVVEGLSELIRQTSERCQPTQELGVRVA
jgi:hypothetical protein